MSSFTEGQQVEPKRRGLVFTEVPETHTYTHTYTHTHTHTHSVFLELELQAWLNRTRTQIPFLSYSRRLVCLKGI